VVLRRLDRWGIFFVYQLWLIRTRDRQACFQAFLNNNYFGMSVFLGIALNYQFGPSVLSHKYLTRCAAPCGAGPAATLVNRPRHSWLTRPIRPPILAG